MSAWHHIEAGSGRPLVLIHGIGLSSRAWEPVMDLLAAERRVIAFDLPGFGRTPSMPAQLGRDCQTLARQLAPELARLGIAPGEADLAGNSLGGLIGLHASADGLLRSAALLSPTGLWHERGARHSVPFLRALRLALRVAPSRATQAMVRSAALRTLMFAVPMTLSGWKIPTPAALAALEDFTAATDFEVVLDAIAPFRRGDQIRTPCSIAFGARDLLLTRASQARDLLPGHVNWIRPRGWGHVPMWDDPIAVADWILEATE